MTRDGSSSWEKRVRRIGDGPDVGVSTLGGWGEQRLLREIDNRLAVEDDGSTGRCLRMADVDGIGEHEATRARVEIEMHQ